MWQADRLTIRVVMENWIDMLLADQDAPARVQRNGLIEHFDRKATPPVAENGISFVVEATSGRRKTCVVFDAGLTGAAITHNIRALDIDASSIDHLVVSHGHPDHYGGIYAFLDAIGRVTPVTTHPESFLPRYAILADGGTSQYYNATFSVDELESHGGRVVASRDPAFLGCGIWTTGEIPRTSGFEAKVTWKGFAPGLYQVSIYGKWEPDEVRDEQALVIDVRDEGLVILTGCAHAGVVNTIHRALEVSGSKPVRALMGGFHLGFPTTPPHNVDLTVEAIRDLEVQTIMPMHCSGLITHSAFKSSLGDRYIQPAVGTVLRFGA